MHNPNKVFQYFCTVTFFIIISLTAFSNSMDSIVYKAESFDPSNIDSMVFYLDQVDFKKLSSKARFQFRKSQVSRAFAKGPFEDYQSAINQLCKEFPARIELRDQIWFMNGYVLYGKKEQADSLKNVLEIHSQKIKSTRIYFTYWSFYNLFSHQKKYSELQNQWDEASENDKCHFINSGLNMSRIQLRDGAFKDSYQNLIGLITCANTIEKNTFQYTFIKSNLLAILGRNTGQNELAFKNFEELDFYLSSTGYKTAELVNYLQYIPFLISFNRLDLAKEKVKRMQLIGKQLKSQFWINRARVFSAIIFIKEKSFALADYDLENFDFSDDRFQSNKQLLHFAQILRKIADNQELSNDDVDILESKTNYFTFSQLDLILAEEGTEQKFPVARKYHKKQLKERQSLQLIQSFGQDQTDSKTDKLPQKQIALVSVLSILAISLLVFLMSKKRSGNKLQTKEAFLQSRISSIKQDRPSLSNTEIEYINLLLLGKSNQKIAVELNVTPGSVSKAKFRLKRKLEVPDDFDLEEYLHTRY